MNDRKTREKLPIENPALSRDWDFEKNAGRKPEDFTAASNKVVWWKCKLGHSWQASISNRITGRGCPYCTGRKVLPGFNDLFTTQPNIAVQWDHEKNLNLSPEQFSAGSNAKVWWKCKLGHSWEALISSRKKNGCPYCSGRRPISGVNDLLTVNADLVAQWDYEKNGDLRPDFVASNTTIKVWWRCGKGHSWQAKVSNRNNGARCPCCSGRLPVLGETDLRTLRPDLYSEWDFEKNHNLIIEQIAPWSNKKVWWKCERGHSYEAVVASRTRGNGCPYCSGRRPIIGETDFRTVHPELMLEWDCEKNQPLRPEDVTATSGIKIWWLCDKGHSWKAKVSHRKNGTGCPYCHGKLADRGKTDLSSVLPELAREWDFERNVGIVLEDIKPYSNKRVWWICKNGHHWRSPVGARYAGAGCPYCHGKVPMRTRLVM